MEKSFNTTAKSFNHNSYISYSKQLITVIEIKKDRASIIFLEWMVPFERQKRFHLLPFDKEEELPILPLSREGLSGYG